ncbi:MAG: hypothetical protein ABI747_04450 [Candidatus Moraniibacteriota bacterium]
MDTLPIIRLFETSNLREEEYRLWIMKRDGVVVAIFLSPCTDTYTQGRLRSEYDADTQSLEASLDVFRDPEHPEVGLTGNFLSHRHTLLERVSGLAAFVGSDEQKNEWVQALGIPLSFDGKSLVRHAHAVSLGD